MTPGPIRRRPLLAMLVALAALASLLAPATATTAERMLLFGAASGSHLVITTDGDRIEVEGLMASRSPEGCRLAGGRVGAVCDLAGAGAIELQMGDSGDLVEVADPLPVPLTIHLGAGSDKFVGNSEPDTCYPEGSRRNRCVGAGGHDVCITGNQNTDCLGGPGNDYCQEGAGSDGCWGGPGDDTCRMGAGQDGCHGGPGDDRLFGGPAADQLYGGPGFDFCDGGRGVGKSHSCEAGPRH